LQRQNNFPSRTIVLGVNPTTAAVLKTIINMPSFSNATGEEQLATLQGVNPTTAAVLNTIINLPCFTGKTVEEQLAIF